MAPRGITLPPRSASCKQGEGRAGRLVLTTVTAPRGRLVLDGPGSWARDHSGGQDDVAHFIVARSRRPGRTAQGVLVEAAAGQLATRVALHGGQTTVRAEADPHRVDEGVLLKVARGPRVELPRPLMRRGHIAQVGDAARVMPGLWAVLGREPLRQFGAMAVRRCCKCCAAAEAGCSASSTPGSTCRPAQRQSWPQRLPPRWRKSATRLPCGRRRGESHGWRGRIDRRIEGRNASVNGDTSLPLALIDVHHVGPRFGAGCDEREKGLLGGGAQADATMTHATLGLSDRDKSPPSTRDSMARCKASCWSVSVVSPETRSKRIASLSRWASNCRCTPSTSPITAPSTSSGALGWRTRQARRTEGLSTSAAAVDGAAAVRPHRPRGRLGGPREQPSTWRRRQHCALPRLFRPRRRACGGTPGTWRGACSPGHRLQTKRRQAPRQQLAEAARGDSSEQSPARHSTATPARATPHCSDPWGSPLLRATVRG